VGDALLESPRYGERWDGTDGYADLRYFYLLDVLPRRDSTTNAQRRHIWQLRDWILESLNADKLRPYDIREMVAGRRDRTERPEISFATGFLARHYIFSLATCLLQYR